MPFTKPPLHFRSADLSSVNFLKMLKDLQRMQPVQSSQKLTVKGAEGESSVRHQEAGEGPLCAWRGQGVHTPAAGIPLSLHKRERALGTRTRGGGGGGRLGLLLTSSV